jgi:hypothetical protein
MVVLRAFISMHVAYERNVIQTWGANLKTAKEGRGAKRRARVGEPSSEGMVNDFPLILGEREYGTKARISTTNQNVRAAATSLNTTSRQSAALQIILGSFGDAGGRALGVSLR